MFSPGKKKMCLCLYTHFLATSGRPRPHLPLCHAPPLVSCTSQRHSSGLLRCQWHDVFIFVLSPCLCALRHPEPSGPCSSERPRPASPGGRECSLQSLQPLFWAQRTHHHKHTLCWYPVLPNSTSPEMELFFPPSLSVSPLLGNKEHREIFKDKKQHEDYLSRMTIVWKCSNKIWHLADGCLDDLMAGDRLAGLNSAVAWLHHLRRKWGMGMKKHLEDQ